MFNLFDRKNGNVVFFELFDDFQDICKMFPIYSFGCAERRFVDFLVRRRCGNPAQVDFFDQECVGRAENRADVVQAPDVVQYNNERRFFGFFEIGYGFSIELTVF